jgi:hypothetical protein
MSGAGCILLSIVNRDARSNQLDYSYDTCPDCRRWHDTTSIPYARNAMTGYRNRPILVYSRSGRHEKTATWLRLLPRLSAADPVCAICNVDLSLQLNTYTWHSRVLGGDGCSTLWNPCRVKVPEHSAGGTSDNLIRSITSRVEAPPATQCELWWTRILSRWSDLGQRYQGFARWYFPPAEMCVERPGT